MASINEILEFWFNGLNDEILIIHNNSIVKRWFMNDSQFDSEIRERFEPDLKAAAVGQRKDWEETIKGRLALVILFDQFSRNIYRGSPQAFITDPLALNLTQRSIKEKTDRSLPLIERLFLYMPLMHAEDHAVQKLSVDTFQELLRQSKEKSPQNTAYYESTLSYARQHKATIDRFGFFPHRIKDVTK